MENNTRSKTELEEIITMIRLNLYNHGLYYGPREIRKVMIVYNLRPLLSERSISCVLVRKGLTHKRTGWYPEVHQNG
jgi:putative transposase